MRGEMSLLFSRFHRPICLVLLPLAVVSCGGGCRGGGTAASTGDASVNIGSLTLTKEQAAKVVARVGDETITVGDVAAALEHMDEFDRIRFQAPERRKELLEEMVNVALLAAEAKRKGYDKDPVTEEVLRHPRRRLPRPGTSPHFAHRAAERGCRQRPP